MRRATCHRGFSPWPAASLPDAFSCLSVQFFCLPATPQPLPVAPTCHFCLRQQYQMSLVFSSLPNIFRLCLSRLFSLINWMSCRLQSRPLAARLRHIWLKGQPRHCLENIGAQGLGAAPLENVTYSHTPSAASSGFQIGQLPACHATPTCPTPPGCCQPSPEEGLGLFHACRAHWTELVAAMLILEKQFSSFLLESPAAAAAATPADAPCHAMPLKSPSPPAVDSLFTIMDEAQLPELPARGLLWNTCPCLLRSPPRCSFFGCRHSRRRHHHSRSLPQPR